MMGLVCTHLCLRWHLPGSTKKRTCYNLSKKVFCISRQITGLHNMDNWGHPELNMRWSSQRHCDQHCHFLSITRNHSSRMYTARFSDSGGFHYRDPWTETSLDREPLPWKEHGTKQEVTSYRDPPHGQTDTWENITLPQTSFAGGKNIDIHRDCIGFWDLMVSTLPFKLH